MATGGRTIVRLLASRSLKRTEGAVRSVGMRNRCSERAMSSDSTRRLFSVTRIYSDDAGDSHFGSFTIDMKGSGRHQLVVLDSHTPLIFRALCLWLQVILATSLDTFVVRRPFCSDTLQPPITTPGIMLPEGINSTALLKSPNRMRLLPSLYPPLSPSLPLSFPFPLPFTLRQFIVNLDGDVEIEVSSGEKRVLRRGTVFFVEDLTGKTLHVIHVNVHPTLLCHKRSSGSVVRVSD